MEPVGSLSEGEWSCSLSGMYNTTEEADFMAQLLANPLVPGSLESCSSLGDHSNYWPGHESMTSMVAAGTNKSVCCSSEMANPNMFYFLDGSNAYSGPSSSSFFPTPTLGNENYFLNDPNTIPVNNESSMGMEFCTGDRKSTSSYLGEGNDCMHQENTDCNPDHESCGNGNQPEADGNRPDVQDDQPMEEHDNVVSENKKRSRNVEGKKSKRNVRGRRNQKRVSASNDEEESSAAPSTCCSNDDSNASQEQNAGESPTESSKDQAGSQNLNGKSRASRGTATDPQSLYARKRRERINERLKILQSLVPNGTKVDISTMLEEAVQYVKFLQLQIKLLSSDDLWMYAPLAYNGMNIGLDLNIPTPPKRS